MRSKFEDFGGEDQNGLTWRTVPVKEKGVKNNLTYSPCEPGMLC